jgi:hypothetical protein
MPLKSHTASNMAFLNTNRDLKLVFFLSMLIMSAVPVTAYGQTSSEFGYRLIPSKIVENTEGILQVYVKGGMAVPKQINNLIVTTSDSSVVQILGVEQNENGYATSVRIKGAGSGTTNIALAAPGFLSHEFPITVYSNKHNPTQLLIKITPNTFSPNGPTKGYVSVELTDEDGFPTKATADTPITLTTSITDIVNLKNKELVISKGEYFTFTEFEVNKPGNTLIYVSSPNMQTVSSKVTLGEAAQPTVQLYVYPSKINSFSSSYAYAIVQLVDSTGNPVKATEDISLSSQVTDPNLQSVNTSGEASGVTSNEVLEIKKGSYWGYAKIVTRAGLEGTYDIRISAKDYLVSESSTLQIVNLELLDDKTPKLDILPVLATGEKELIGVIHLEDDTGNPVSANKNLQIKIDSSDENSLSVNDVKIDKGLGVSLVFADVGYVPPSSLTLRVVTETDVSVVPTITGSIGTLVAESLIPKILSNTNFPLILYMSSSDGSSYFPEDLELSISPNEFIKIEPKMIKKGQSVLLLDTESVKSGSTTVSLQAGNLLGSTTIENLSSKPATVQLDHPEKILSGLNNTFSIQMLDSQSFPVFADHDIEIQLVANDPSVVSMPEHITIKKGEYYTLFDVEAKKTGKIELAVLTSEIQLSKFDISIESLTPVITMSPPDYVNPNTDFDIAVSAKYLDSSLSGLNVEWTVQGAAIQKMDSITNENGMATISLLSQDPAKVDIQASVSGGMFGTTIVNKQVNVNQPLQSASSPSGTFDIAGINSLLIIIPAAIGAAIIILKKKGMLEGITEKLNLGEKISEIKERLSREK